MSHQAALIPSKGHPLVVESVETAQPGPEELLISVLAIALNPIDYFMRDVGMFIANYPAIIGSDIAGTVEAVGSEVAPSSSSPFKKGARVLAFAVPFYKQGQPDANKYGGFQQKVVVPVENVAVIPDSVSFVDASTLPMSVGVSTNTWPISQLSRGFLCPSFLSSPSLPSVSRPFPSSLNVTTTPTLPTPSIFPHRSLPLLRGFTY